MTFKKLMLVICICATSLFSSDTQYASTGSSAAMPEFLDTPQVALRLRQDTLPTGLSTNNVLDSNISSGTPYSNSSLQLSPYKRQNTIEKLLVEVSAQNVQFVKGVLEKLPNLTDAERDNILLMLTNLKEETNDYSKRFNIKIPEIEVPPFKLEPVNIIGTSLDEIPSAKSIILGLLFFGAHIIAIKNA
ncbi:MAG: hypothetical protein HEEMFOPI_00403 [Holosporales bacterium]